MDVRAFGADPSGRADSTAAIQAAIDNTTLGTIFLPAGTYLVTPVREGDALKPHGGLSIVGDGIGKTVIRVRDNAGEYRAVFYQAKSVGNMMFRDLTIDSNVTANRLTERITSFPRYSIEASYGSNTVIERVEFRNTSDVNTVVIGGTEAMVANCVFNNIGSDPLFHDHSTIYIHAERARVIGNVFNGAGVTSGGATTAIETHGGEQIVTNNIVNGYRNGSNITGIDDKVGASTNIIVANNSFKNVGVGVHVWSGKYGRYTEGYGIDGMVISGNSFLLKESGARNSYELSGIEFEPNNNLPIRNVSISGNTIVYDLSTPPSHHEQGYLKSAIQFYSTQSPVQVLENLSITGNTIAGPPGSGIFLHCGLRNALISGNIIRDVGGDPGALHRSGIWLSGNGTEVVEGVDINGNQIVDTRKVARMKTGIQFNYARSARSVQALNNTILVFGADASDFLYSYYVSNANIRPYVVGDVESFSKVHNEGTAIYRTGSRFTEVRTGRVYTNGSESAPGGFRFVAFAPAPPSDNNLPARVGDVVYNTGPGKVLFWKCTAPGAPGGWEAVTFP